MITIEEIQEDLRFLQSKIDLVHIMNSQIVSSLRCWIAKGKYNKIEFRKANGGYTIHLFLNLL